MSYASSGAGVTVTVNSTGAGTASGIGSDAAGDTISNFENVIGSAHSDILTGDGLANILTGGAGNDRLDGGLGADTMIGGLGDDTFVVGIATDKVTELAGGGTDTIETSLATYSLNVAALLDVENLTYDNGLAADANFIGTGNLKNNTITGGTGSDTLNGGLGADLLIGGAGSDTYTVDNAGDVADESGGGALDHVQSSVSFDLSNAADAIGDIEKLTLTGALAINGTGSAIANTIIGNTGANVIEGKGGADILNGGAGLDTVSYASSASGVSILLNGALAGTVSGGDAALDTITNFENIIGSAAVDTLTGDTLANVIEGGASGDTLNGGAGLDTVSYASSGAGVTVTLNGALAGTVSGGDAAGDTITNFENIIGSGSGDILTGDGLVNILNGGAGNDRLDGGIGADTMIGGLGDDTFVVGIATDKVTELALGGTDTVETSLLTYSLNVAALAQVENLTFTGAGVFTGTGNALANTITGGGGADNLNGGLGNDTLIGGAGADSFIFNSSIAAVNVDTIDDFSVADDTIRLENAIFTTVGAAGVLAAGAFVSGAFNTAAQRISYNSADGSLTYDSNGSTAGGVVVTFATLDPGLVLTNADFLIV